MGFFTRERPSQPGREERMLTFISPPVGPYTQALQDYGAGDPEGAMRTSAVWSSVNKIALSLAMMTPSAYKGPGVSVGDAVRQDTPQILVQPGADANYFEWTYAAWLSLKLRGNVTGIIVDQDPLTRLPTQIELQHPDQVRVRRLDNGQYEWRVRNEVMDPSKIWHKGIHRMPGSRIGMSTIQYAARSTRLVQNAQRFGSDYFQDGGHPTGVLTNQNAAKITQEQAATVKEKFVAALHGSREPIVMGQGWDYTQIQIKPDESQFLNTIAATKAEIYEFFGLKPTMMGQAPPSGSSVTYQNVEQNSLDFLLYPISPWLILWEAWMTELLPPGQYAKCDTGGLVRTDLLTRWTAYHMMIGSRALTQDEVRELDDRPPLTPEQRQEVDNATLMPMPAPINKPTTGE